ncbi:MAG: hypothetical protein NTY14_07085 [Candidatus Omnitrophica bacterium]|nr:hypothetical protein [Candidatus Omnitrophota bacterium]
MRKKTLVAIAVIIFFLFGITLHLAAQKMPQPGEQLPQNFDIVANLRSVQDQVSALASSVGTENQQVLNKLDQVLSNQDKILQELEVVKIRASRSR